MPRARARDLARRSIGAVIVTALLGAAVVVGAGLTMPGSAAPTAGSPVTAPIRTISPASSTSASVTPGESASPSSPGIAIDATPEADGSFLVREVVTLPAGTTEAVLTPPSIGDAGTGFERLRPTAVDVEVDADGQLVAVPDGPIATEVTVRWDAPTTTLRLSYRLRQVSVTSAPAAKAGRALAVFDSLMGGLPADMPVTVVVRGRTVLSLTCPQLPLTELSCGAGIAPKFWTLHPIPYDRSRVQVQYDRPARS